MSLSDPPWEKIDRKPAPAMKQAGMTIDLRRCVGCHSCSIACKTEHEVALGNFRMRVRWLPRPEDNRIAFLPLLCMHCEDAPCLSACPESVLTRRPDGRVVAEQGSCTGCGDCTSSCPYGALSVNPQTNHIEKCDLCEHRTSVGLEPACADACPTQAIVWGDLADPNSKVSKTRKELKTEPFRPAEKTKPRVEYAGLEEWTHRAANRGVALDPKDPDIIYEQS